MLMDLTVRQDEVTIQNSDGEIRQKTVTFQFDPTQVEMVRAKDGAYIIRERRTRSVASFPKEEVQSS
jgi:hypothetical protein